MQVNKKEKSCIIKIFTQNVAALLKQNKAKLNFNQKPKLK
jgi:hypothetical protein